MQINTTVIRSGFDGKKCFVHARFCETPSYLIATAQYLTDITACDLFDGIYSSKSYDGGKTWGEEIVISSDSPVADLGYPSSVELSDGSILTVYYQRYGNDAFTSILGTRWRLDESKLTDGK